MFAKSIESLTIEAIESFIVAEPHENQTLDYKNCSPLNKGEDNDKYKFARHISAMANTSGGYLIYGIEQGKNGEPNKIKPFEIENNNFDKLKTTLEQVLASRLEPKLYGCKYQPILTKDNKY